MGYRVRLGDLVFTLDRAIKTARITDAEGLAIRSDNGPQMTSKMMREYLGDLELDLSHEFIPPSTPNKNAHIESFFSIVETEFSQTGYFRRYGDAYQQTLEFMEHYHKRRIHGSLGQVTPLEAELAFAQGVANIREIRI